MKKIINGKLYNTETAKYLATAAAPYARNDFDFWEEELYLKKTGEYFIYGAGNARSQYAERYGNCYGSGEDIRPVSVDAAKKWSEKYLTADEYIEIWGEVEE